MAREDKGVVDSYKDKNGIEYVSVAEFSRRSGVAVNTINKFIREKRLKITKEVGYKRYLAWEREYNKLKVIQQKNILNAHGGGRIKTKTGDIKTSETKEVKDTEDIQDTVIDINQLFKNFNPEDFKDCIAMDNEGVRMRDADGNYILEWPTVDRKITALIRNLELKRKEGELIKIDEVVRFLSIAFAKTQGKLSNIPDRYTSRFAAFYQKETGNEVSNETTTALKNMLTAETKNILADLSKEIENSEYGEN